MTKPKGYKVVKTWKNLPVYGCSECDFETMKEDMMKNHVKAVHRRPKPPKVKPTPPPIKRDRFGVPIRESVVPPMKKSKED